jgi:hypothetical protein
MILRFLRAEYNRPVTAEGKIKAGRGSGIDFPTEGKLTPTPAATTVNWTGGARHTYMDWAYNTGYTGEISPYASPVGNPEK